MAKMFLGNRLMTPAMYQIAGEATIDPITVTPQTVAQSITATQSVDGYAPITVEAVTSAIDNNIRPENIKKNVSILGCVGSYEGGSSTLVTKSITQNGTYYASNDNADGYSSVTVNVSGGSGSTSDYQSYVEVDGTTLKHKNAQPIHNFDGTEFVNVTEIEEMAFGSAFFSNDNITGTLNFPNVTYLGPYAFMDDMMNGAFAYSNIDGVLFPNLQEVDSDSLGGAFQGTHIESVSFDSLETVGDYAMSGTFASSGYMLSGSFPNLRTIGYGGMTGIFAYSFNFESCDFSSLVSVGDWGLNAAFSNCNGLTEVHFPSLVEIGEEGLAVAFQGCINLEDLYFEAVTESTFEEDRHQIFEILAQCGTSKQHRMHFPSNLESVIETLEGYPTFGENTNTVLLFDLPPTN